MDDLMDILTQWKEEAHVASPIQFRIHHKTGTLSIFTNKPGYLIGREGILVQKYTDILRTAVKGFSAVREVRIY